MEEILKIEDLQYHYGAVHALRGIDITVERGEIVAILGSNGAGKTTTLRSISGLLGAPRRGKILFRGDDITKRRPEKIASSGISHVLEGRHIFPKLTVRENLVMGAFSRSRPFRKGIDYVYRLFPRLEEREKQEGGTLSGGEQQMLAVGRALMSNPEILLMDEPSLGLAPLIVKEIFAIIKQINKDGVTILLVEQNSKAALNVASRGYVMVNGEVAFANTAERLMTDENVKKTYLGED